MGDSTRFGKLEKGVEKDEELFEGLSGFGLWVWRTGLVFCGYSSPCPFRKEREKSSKRKKERKGKKNWEKRLISESWILSEPVSGLVEASVPIGLYYCYLGLFMPLVSLAHPVCLSWVPTVLLTSLLSRRLPKKFASVVSVVRGGATLLWHGSTLVPAVVKRWWAGSLPPRGSPGFLQWMRQIQFLINFKTDFKFTWFFKKQYNRKRRI